MTANVTTISPPAPSPCSVRKPISSAMFWLSPPRSPTIVGSAVETIVWSSDASSRTSISATKIRRRRCWGWIGSSTTPGILPTFHNYCFVQLCERTMKPSSPDDTRQILEGLSAVTRQLARASGGPDEGPPMTSTQRLALFETAVGGPLRLSELAERMGITAPTASRAVDGLVELGLVERL